MASWLRSVQFDGRRRTWCGRWDRPVRVDRETLSLGYAGVYSSFLRHAERPARTIVVCAPSWSSWGAGMVGSQEDMITDVALDLARSAQD
jgi:4-hydroxy 2-oxovalerate aldolase